jgi:type IV pilus assembly protein PilA
LLNGRLTAISHRQNTKKIVFGEYLGEGTSPQEGEAVFLCFPFFRKGFQKGFRRTSSNPPRKEERFVRYKQAGFSVIELLIVVAIILIIAAIAIPNLIASRERANEAAAVEALRTLSSSEAAYNVTYGPANGYAGTLAALGPGDGTGCNQAQACLVDAQLGCSNPPCLRGAYNFYMKADPGSAPFQDYAFTATPLTWNISGVKNFCATEDGIIRYQVDGTASLGSPVPHDTCSNFAIYTNIQ